MEMSKEKRREKGLEKEWKRTREENTKRRDRGLEKK